MKLRKVLNYLLLLSIGVTLSSCYVTKQGTRQLGLLMDREPIDDVLQQEATPTKDKEKLKLTKQLVTFASQQGLDVGSAYQKYVALHRDVISYTVQAARPTLLVLKTWWFPIIGSVPYLGYFDREDRDQMAEDLEADGYEVYRGSVTAFSSLGWFADPVYSSMLRRTDVELGHLYFHELTHRTLWVNDSVEFNENLAEFVADYLTEFYFRAAGRVKELDEYNIVVGDYQLFNAWIRGLRADLATHLASTANQPLEERVRAKNEVIAQTVIGKRPHFKKVDFVGKEPWNNARILGASLYAPDAKSFKSAFDCFLKRTLQDKKQDQKDVKIGDFLLQMGVKAREQKDGFSALKAMCIP